MNIVHLHIRPKSLFALFTAQNFTLILEALLNDNTSVHRLKDTDIASVNFIEVLSWNKKFKGHRLLHIQILLIKTNLQVFLKHRKSV